MLQARQQPSQNKANQVKTIATRPHHDLQLLSFKLNGIHVSAPVPQCSVQRSTRVVLYDKQQVYQAAICKFESFETSANVHWTRTDLLACMTQYDKIGDR